MLDDQSRNSMSRMELALNVLTGLSSTPFGHQRKGLAYQGDLLLGEVHENTARYAAHVSDGGMAARMSVSVGDWLA